MILARRKNWFTSAERRFAKNADFGEAMGGSRSSTHRPRGETHHFLTRLNRAKCCQLG
jgi:hypothetical protein